jgi:hypothetical protein
MTPRLDGSDRMPWGRYRGQRLQDVPPDYWAWLLAQPWFRDHHDLYEYADRATTPKMTWEETMRLVSRF